MKDIQFPVFKTKLKDCDKTFDLINPKETQEYFELKAGFEIKKIKNYLKDNTFIAYLLGKKNSGKGTYSKIFGEIIGKDKVAHISVGDVVRKVHNEILNDQKKKELQGWLLEHYRGYISIDEAIEVLLGRSTEHLLPTEFILALVKREIDQIGRKVLFIDGFPREMDQVSYSLFFRDLVGYRSDPDIFVLIDVPEKVIHERIKFRVICPNCHTPRNLKLFPVKDIRYEEKEKRFFFLCDNPFCRKIQMVAKEGDDLGIEPIKKRLQTDEKLIKQAFFLHGIPKVLLRNSVPVDMAKEYVDDYEITPEYVLQYIKNTKTVKVTEKPWIFEDEQGIPSYSLLPQPVALSLIKQLPEALRI